MASPLWRRQHPYRERISLTPAHGGEPSPVPGVPPLPVGAAARRLLRPLPHPRGKPVRPQRRYRNNSLRNVPWMRRHWLPKRIVWRRNTACRHRAAVWWCCPGTMTGMIFPLLRIGKRRPPGRRPVVRRRSRPLLFLNPYRQRRPSLRRLLPLPPPKSHLRRQKAPPNVVVRAVRRLHLWPRTGRFPWPRLPHRWPHRQRDLSLFGMPLMRRPLCLMRGCPSLPQGGEPFPARGIQPHPAGAVARRLLQPLPHPRGKPVRPQRRYRSDSLWNDPWMRRHWLPRRIVWLRNTACRHRAAVWWCCPGTMTGMIFPLLRIGKRRPPGRRPVVRRRSRPLLFLSPYRQRPPLLRRLLLPPSPKPHLQRAKAHPCAAVGAARQQRR